MRVAIVYPEVLDLARFKEKRKEFPPFGVLYLAAVIEEEGMTATMFKISHSKQYFDFTEFDAVAFSIPSSATYGMVKFARFNSLYKNHSLIMIGGVHANFYPERTLLDLQPDVVGVGEGEETIIELLASSQRRDFKKIAGICYLENGNPVRTEPRVIKKNIDHLPLPARHLLTQDDFIMSDRLSNTDLRMAHVMFTRGCPFGCRFCAAARTKAQFRSGHSARLELEALMTQYRIDGFAIVDDNFIIDKKKVHDICASIEDLGLKWSALSRVDTVDQSLLAAMKRSGCIEVKFGVESGSEMLLKRMGKDTSQAQIKKALQIAHNEGIANKIFLIHGYPGENLTTTRETMKFLAEISPLVERVSLFRFVPLPGTYTYDHPEEFKLRNTDNLPGWDGDWSRYHIHHNDLHWWGSEKDFQELTQGYIELESFIKSLWQDRF